jgi:hypothetical protein
VATQNVAHRGVIDVRTQVGQGPLNTPVTPAWILGSHADDELLNLPCHAWTSQGLSQRFAAGRLDNKAAIPPLERVRSSNGRNVLEMFSVNGVRQNRQTSALRIGELNPLPLELRFQDAIFFMQGSNDVVLVTTDPGGQHGDQKR